MTRHLALGRAGRPVRRLGTVAGLAFVLMVALAFWAAVALTARNLLLAG